MKDNGFLGGIYGMAFIGAAFYYIQHAATFWAGVLGFFKALFWPAVLMYKLLEFLKM
ncbi:membrane protein [Peptococcaceae bacterium SCADC1_2_3]|nr:membrane protein [Peptococcaceae bacterium SCADC1_2_3]KFI35974.1 membrane protein [Peptococcaceae bacterium SCADC1_2_3]KFI36750.1 membrane protein [Peptococcaceae bacterium SCADC1_2_3]